MFNIYSHVVCISICYIYLFPFRQYVNSHSACIYVFYNHLLVNVHDSSQYGNAAWIFKYTIYSAIVEKNVTYSVWQVENFSVIHLGYYRPHNNYSITVLFNYYFHLSYDGPKVYRKSTVHRISLLRRETSFRS